MVIRKSFWFQYSLQYISPFQEQSIIRMKWLKRIAYFFVFVYIILCIGLYFVQDRIIFHPHPIDQSHQFRTGIEVELKVEEGVFMNCLWIKEPNAKGAILYLHGNRGNIRRCIRQAQMMEGNGYDLFLVDYRSYGKSDGQLKSEEQLFADVQIAYDFLKKSYPENRIAIVGYSIGTGMASYIAAHNNPQQLALVAPYVSLLDLKNRYIPIIPGFLMKFRFRNDLYLPMVKCPVTIFHGTDDNVIPYDSAVDLEALDPKKIKLITLKGVSHRGAIFSRLFVKTMAANLN